MADKMFNLQIISPTRVFFDGDAEMVEMKTTEGEIGVLAISLLQQSLSQGYCVSGRQMALRRLHFMMDSSKSQRTRLQSLQNLVNGQTR